MEFRTIWERKPVLRTIYTHYYRRITALTVPGRTLEIGGGSGNLKRFLPDVMTTDILAASWLDAVADAQRLPFQDRTFDNIVFVDVLHHIEDPAAFFGEARRVLRDGGRIVMVEPAMTPLSYPFYKFVHDEPTRMDADPLAAPAPRTGGRDPFDSNQAIPCLIFGRHLREFERRFPEFSLVTKRHLSLFAYPLSGGFQRWCVVPSRAVESLLKVEDRLERFLGPLMGFRLLVALSYRSDD
jgi:SAM-dependent methyltransferase